MGLLEWEGVTQPPTSPTPRCQGQPEVRAHLLQLTQLLHHDQALVQARVLDGGAPSTPRTRPSQGWRQLPTENPPALVNVPRSPPQVTPVCG